MNPLFIVIIALIIHIALYFGSELLQKNPHILGWELDKRIPTLYGFVYVYLTWMPLLGLVPLLLSAYSTHDFYRYLLAWAIDMAISIIVFIAYPTTCAHPKPQNSGFTGFVCRLVFRGSFRYLNSAPSVHCSMSLLFFVAVLVCPGFPAILQAAICLLSALIIISTVLVKQHVLVDVVTALPVAAVSWVLAMLILG